VASNPSTAGAVDGARGARWPSVHPRPEADPDGRFGGEIYNAEDGRTYGVTIWRETLDRLKVKG